MSDTNVTRSMTTGAAAALLAETLRGTGVSRQMTTGAAAALLGVSVQKVRRMIAAGELDAVWTHGDAPSVDRHGHLLRGHRRVDAESVARCLSRRAGSAASG